MLINEVVHVLCSCVVYMDGYMLRPRGQRRQRGWRDLGLPQLLRRHLLVSTVVSSGQTNAIYISAQSLTAF